MLQVEDLVMVYPGDSLTCWGVVTSLYREGDDPSTSSGQAHSAGPSEGPGFAECDLWIENQRGERVVDRANAVVQLPLRAESGQRR